MSTKDSGQAFFIPNGDNFMISLSRAHNELTSVRRFTAVFVGDADFFFTSVGCLVVPTALTDNALTPVMTVAIQDLVADLANHCQRTYDINRCHEQRSISKHFRKHLTVTNLLGKVIDYLLQTIEVMHPEIFSFTGYQFQGLSTIPNYIYECML